MTQLNTTLFAAPVTGHGQAGHVAVGSDCSFVIAGTTGTGHVGDLDAVVGDNSVPLYGVQIVGEAGTFTFACEIVLPAIVVRGLTVEFAVQSSDYPDGNSISSSIRVTGVVGQSQAGILRIAEPDVLVVVMA